jgi:uncharacterized protein DUF2154/cell wall-active antibiotic response 4TMS protein YvqF
MPDNDGLRSRSLVFPILLITIGAIFLYRTWQPAFSPWPVLRTYWPLILILVGLGKMWDATQGAKQSPRPFVSIGSTVGVLVFVLILVLLLWRGHGFADLGHHHLGHISEIRELDGATSLNAVIEMPAGELNLSGGTSHAFESDFDYSSAWSQPRVDYRVSSGTGDLDISQDNRGPSLGPEDNTWWLHLNKSVPLDLQLKMGAAQGNLKFRDVNLKQLRVEIGVGQVNVDLTGDHSADANVEIHGGIGQAVIRLPKNVGVVVNAKGGIGAVTTHGLKKEDDNYVNDAYQKSPHTLHITVAGGIGNIDLSVEP